MSQPPKPQPTFDTPSHGLPANVVVEGGTVRRLIGDFTPPGTATSVAAYHDASAKGEAALNDWSKNQDLVDALDTQINITVYRAGGDDMMEKLDRAQNASELPGAAENMLKNWDLIGGTIPLMVKGLDKNSVTQSQQELAHVNDVIDVTESGLEKLYALRSQIEQRLEKAVRAAVNRGGTTLTLHPDLRVKLKKMIKYCKGSSLLGLHTKQVVGKAVTAAQTDAADTSPAETPPATAAASAPPPVTPPLTAPTLPKAAPAGKTKRASTKKTRG